MEVQRRRGGVRLLKRIITAVFAVGFVVSLFSTFSAFAAANFFQITNAKLTEISTTAEGDIVSFDEQNIVSNVTFHKLGDITKYTITLKNTDSRDHVIESITNDNENPYVAYEYDSYADTKVLAGDTLDFVVTAEYAAPVTDIDARVQVVNVKFMIKYTDVEEAEEFLLVPNTGENTNLGISAAIQTSVTGLVVFAAGLIFCMVLYIKNHKKSAKVLGVFVTLIAATTVFAGVRAVAARIDSFTLTTNYGFYDKNIIKNGEDKVVINHCTKFSDITEITAPTKIGYTFDGFENQDGEAIGADAEICKDTELTPKFTAITYKVRFHRNGATGGEDMADQVVTYDEVTTLIPNAYEREHYKFMGWATSTTGDKVYDDQADITNILSEDGGILDLYAVWLERTATLETGSNVNASLKAINSAATSFAHYAGTPNFDEIEGEVDIALATSNFPVWVWAEDDAIYWWSEAEVPNYNINSSNMFNKMTTLETIDLKGLNSNTATNMSNFFNECKALKTIDLTDFDSSNVKNMSNMFRYTESLLSIDFTKINTSSATNMSSMFSYNGTPTLDISGFDTSNVQTMRSMFEKAKASTITVGDINTHKVTDMQAMFQDTENVTSLDLKGLDTENVTTMGSMFCAFWTTSKLANLDISTFDTSKVQNFSLMFYGDVALTNLDLRHFNTSSATTMYYMFNAVRSAATINVSGWTNDNVTNMSYMFYGAGNSNTKIIMDNFATPKVTDMTGMFGDARAITELDISSFNTATVTKMTNMFNSSYASTPMALRTIYVGDDFTTDALTGLQVVFTHSRAIVGGAGTTWDSSAENYNMSTYSRVDDPDNGKPGYFTIKGARYIRYHDNDGDDTNDEVNYALMTSHYLTNTGSLKTNVFTNGGKTFVGWNTAADGSGDSYTDGQAMTNLVESKTPLELYAQWESESISVKYAVQIYGINQDVDASGNTLGLTFGPAVGADYNNSYITHEYEETSAGSEEYYVKIITHTVDATGNETIESSYLTDSSSNNVVRNKTQVEERENINLHNMTWEQIKNVEDKTLFEDSMLCGDTKSVNVALNNTIASGLSYDQYGDGAGTLAGSINDTYRNWNPSKSQNEYVGSVSTITSEERNKGSNARNEGAYSASHIRATIIGFNSKTNQNLAGDVNLTESTSLYSGLDSDLKSVITPKKIKYVTGTSKTNYTLHSDIADPIWLFSDREIYGTGEFSGNGVEGLGTNGDGYNKFGNPNSKNYISEYTTYGNDNRKLYNESGAAAVWWLRSADLAQTALSRDVRSSGLLNGLNPYNYYGLSFGFCI